MNDRWEWNEEKGDKMGIREKRITQRKTHKSDFYIAISVSPTFDSKK